MPLNLNIDIKSDSVTKLIDAVQKYVEVRYEPKAIVLKAEAEAKASLILAHADAEKQEIAMRAAQRLANTEIRRQENIESITAKALEELPTSGSKDPVSQDWIAQFYDGCQDIGETDLQTLWARLLAGEVAQPQTFSRRTMETLRTFSSVDAQVVSVLNDCVFTDKSNGTILIFVGFGSYGGVAGTAVTDIENHLISLGLLNTETESLPNTSSDWSVDYCGQEYFVPENAYAAIRALGNYTKIEIRRFTVVGNELLKIVSRSPSQEFVESLQVGFRNSGNQFLSPEEFRELKERIEMNKRRSS